MKKTYIINDAEYKITNCTAIALNAGDTERQDALLIEHTADSGEKFDYVVFGYQMPETSEDFADMCEDCNAWDSDYETLETVVC